MPKPLVLTLPLRSWAPATSHGLQPALPAHACAGKMLNGSVPAKSSARLWVMSGPPPARQSTGDLGCAALEMDGARTGEASGQLYTVERFAPGAWPGPLTYSYLETLVV